MIIDRRSDISSTQLREQLESIPLIGQTLYETVGSNMTDLLDLMQVYRGAMQEISTKLEILDDEYQVRYSHNPIHHMERRIKSVQSIREKLEKNGFDFSIKNIQEQLF